MVASARLGALRTRVMLLLSETPAASPLRVRVPFRVAVKVRMGRGLVSLNWKSRSVARLLKSAPLGVGSLMLMVPVSSSVPPRKPVKLQAGSAKVKAASSGTPSASVSVVLSTVAQLPLGGAENAAA